MTRTERIAEFAVANFPTDKNASHPRRTVAAAAAVASTSRLLSNLASDANPMVLRASIAWAVMHLHLVSYLVGCDDLDARLDELMDFNEKIWPPDGTGGVAYPADSPTAADLCERDTYIGAQRLAAEVRTQQHLAEQHLSAEVRGEETK